MESMNINVPTSERLDNPSASQSSVSSKDLVPYIGPSPSLLPVQPWDNTPATRHALHIDYIPYIEPPPPLTLPPRPDDAPATRHDIYLIVEHLDEMARFNREAFTALAKGFNDIANALNYMTKAFAPISEEFGRIGLNTVDSPTSTRARLEYYPYGVVKDEV